MKTCPLCDKEYLDSYEVCPFCARVDNVALDLTEDRGPDKRVRIRPGFVATIAALGSVAGIIIYVAVQVTFANTGLQLGKTVSEKQACYLNQATVERAATRYEAEEDSPPEKVADLVSDYIDSVPICPSGGGYRWRPELTPARLECTVHGWHGRAP